MTRLVIVMEKNTEFGYIERATFSQDNHDQGGKSYDLRETEVWEDGHETLRKYTNLHRADYANNMYKRYLSDGYKVISKEKFTPMGMDMR